MKKRNAIHHHVDIYNKGVNTNYFTGNIGQITGNVSQITGDILYNTGWRSKTNEIYFNKYKYRKRGIVISAGNHVLCNTLNT